MVPDFLYGGTKPPPPPHRLSIWPSKAFRLSTHHYCTTDDRTPSHQKVWCACRLRKRMCAHFLSSVFPYLPCSLECAVIYSGIIRILYSILILGQLIWFCCQAQVSRRFAWDKKNSQKFSLRGNRVIHKKTQFLCIFIIKYSRGIFPSTKFPAARIIDNVF